MFSKELELQKAKIRLAAIETKGDRAKHLGAIRKLERTIRNLEKEQ